MPLPGLNSATDLYPHAEMIGLPVARRRSSRASAMSGPGLALLRRMSLPPRAG